MRLWHYRLIEVLPDKQLKAMRYEIGDMVKQYPNIKNGLVKYANNYNIEYLFHYFLLVLAEFDKRGINHNNKYDNEIIKLIKHKNTHPLLNWRKFYPEHNNRYYEQCFYNLQEKFDRGIITLDEYLLIRNQRIDIHLGEEEN